MTEFALIAQIIVSLTVISVWTIRYNKATAWRGGDANSMAEEFGTYGLSERMLVLTRITKLSLAALLIAGIWMTDVAAAAALAMAGMMLVAVAMHVKVGDSIRKSVPAFTMLVLCLIVAYTYGVPGVEDATVAAAGGQG